ncbi:MAG: formylglycine-generating enzyme family protein [Pseudomonadota bacterium]
MKPLIAVAFVCAFTLSACTQSVAEPDNQQAVDALLKKTQGHLVYVEGGSFEMGDFGPKDPRGYLPWSVGQDDKHLHKVTLDGYYIMDRQVSYADYDIYTEATGQPLINTDNSSSHTRAPDVPAGVDWYQARDYCQWLAEQSGRPFALPTEAQWEYAARSRGKMMPYATDDGLLREGKNYATREERKKASPGNDPYTPYPVAKKYPPNPLGIHQMGLNGFEWVSDWYEEDYYEHSPEHNPTGPASGKDKVRRGGSVGSGFLGKVTVIRSFSRPNLASKPPEGSSAAIDPDHKQPYMANTLRCVVNQTR